MRFPLTPRLIAEAERFALRSACPHCFFYIARESRCALEWPDRGQSRWPLGARPESSSGGCDERSGQVTEPASAEVVDVEFCKEFELA